MVVLWIAIFIHVVRFVGCIDARFVRSKSKRAAGSLGLSWDPHKMCTKYWAKGPSPLERGILNASLQVRMQQNSSSLAQGMNSNTSSGVFCYALITTPPQETAQLLAKQLTAACDDWSFFGHEDNAQLNSHAAYSAAAEAEARCFQMHEMVIAGAWKNMFDMGILEKYSWVVQVEPDSFVRPSTFRNIFVEFSAVHSNRSIVSVADASDTTSSYPGGRPHHEGFLIGVPTVFAKQLFDFGKTSRSCDTTVSGSDVSGYAGIDAPKAARPDEGPCKRLFGNTSVLVDREGLPVIASDGEGLDMTGKFEHCEFLDEQMLGFGGSGEFCDCHFAGKYAPSCLSKDFVIIHPVKSAEKYRQLMLKFP